MASLIKDKTKGGKAKFRVQYYDKNAKRCSIRLRDMNQKDAEQTCSKIEQLVSATISGNQPLLV